MKNSSPSKNWLSAIMIVSSIMMIVFLLYGSMMVPVCVMIPNAV